MVSWYDREADFPSKVVDMDVTDLGLYSVDDKGEEHQVKSLPICDLDNDEYVKLQYDDFLEQYPGTIAETGSPKSQAYLILITHQRLWKGHNITKKSFTISAPGMMKWATSRSGDLALLIKKTLDERIKKSKSSQKETITKQ